MSPSPLGKTLALTVVIGLLSGAAGALIVNAIPKSENTLRKELYDIENAVHVSPHSIRKGIAKGERNFVVQRYPNCMINGRGTRCMAKRQGMV